MEDFLVSNLSNRSRVVLITAQFETYWLERLQSLSPNLHIELWPTRSAGTVPLDLWREVEILYTSYATPLPFPEQAPRLRWVQLYSAGPDPILDLPLFQTSVIFTTTSGVHATNIAEYVLMIVLAWFHRFPRMLEWQRRGQWPSNWERSSSFVARELRGKSIGIVGYGSIGRAIAR